MEWMTRSQVSRTAINWTLIHFWRGCTDWNCMSPLTDVSIGSSISIRHVHTQGGYLHSHPHNYPGGSKRGSFPVVRRVICQS